MEQKTLIILHSIEDFEFLNRSNRGFYEKKNFIFIAYDLQLRIYLKQKKISFRIQEDYMHRNMPSELDQKAFLLSMNWHGNKFLFRNISLGLLMQYDFFQYFSRILRDTQNILNIIKSENPVRAQIINKKDIYSIEFNKILTYLCTLNDINLEIIQFDFQLINGIIEKKKSKQKFSLFKKSLSNIIFLGISNFLSFIRYTCFRKRQNIFITNINYHFSILKDLIQNYNLLVMSKNINKIELLNNIKNILLRKKGYNFVFLDSYANYIINRKALIYFNSLFPLWKKNIKKIKKNFDYNGISLWPISREKIFFFIVRDFNANIRQIMVHERLLKRERIKFLITGNDAKPNLRSLTILSNNLKIPSLVLQHGMISGVQDMLPSFSNFFGVWGKNGKEILIEYGIDTKKIFIIGAPRFDKYIEISRNVKLLEKIENNVYNTFNIDKNKKIILVTTTYGGLLNRFNNKISLSALEKSLTLPMEAIKDFHNLHLIVKLHPGDHLIDIPLGLQKIFDLRNMSITRNYNIIELIAASDLVVTCESSTILEALLLEKLVICLKMKDYSYFSPILKYDNLYQASSSDELKEFFEQLTRNELLIKDYSNLLRDYLFKFDGNSTNRVVTLIDKLMNMKISNTDF